MDFDDTREEAAFRTDVRQLLGAHAEPKRGAFETWQSRYPGREGWDGLERAQAFQRSKAEAGFAALHWPAEWGACSAHIARELAGSGKSAGGRRRDSPSRDLRALGCAGARGAAALRRLARVSTARGARRH